ncbi:MAG: DJ-1/PfpI family protein [Gemmatimonadaceae bacterium]|nr:DJ-1/PfpI family protein [Gemmatimonadaceae bacterium]
MDRRTFTKAAAMGIGALPLLHRLGPPVRGSAPMKLAMVMYPGMYPLDLVGPHAVLSGALETHLVWKDRHTLLASGIPFTATTTFAECPADVDMLFVPGGTRGTLAAMQDEEVLTFLADRAPRASYITSVCTGSLVLGAAGLLKGRRATSHWGVRDSILPLLGATPVAERVVTDGNVVTGAGVSAGIDLALTLLARIAGETVAKRTQLNIEYDPQPPFHAGSPEAAGPEITAAMVAAYAEFSRGAAVAARGSRRARAG